MKFIRTEGPWLAATVQYGERQLCVMDDFTSDERYAPEPGEDFVVRLSALTDERSSWESMFAGNPSKKKDLEPINGPINGWSYRAFGQIVSIHPVIVDCGILSVPDVLHTNDLRVVGEFIAFTISRLDATLYPNSDATVVTDVLCGRNGPAKDLDC